MVLPAPIKVILVMVDFLAVRITSLDLAHQHRDSLFHLFAFGNLVDNERLAYYIQDLRKTANSPWVNRDKRSLKPENQVHHRLSPVKSKSLVLRKPYPFAKHKNHANFHWLS
jgi:hypothetical protein